MNTLSTLFRSFSTIASLPFGCGAGLGLYTTVSCMPPRFPLLKATTGFGKRLVFCKATIDPIYPLPVNHSILRSNNGNSHICLEGDGLLNVTLKLQISDKKSLGIKTKGRQFLVMFKVNCKDFKEVLNSCIDGLFKDPVKASITYEAVNVHQTFTGTFNNIPVSVTLTQADFGNNFSTSGDGYLKVLAYKMYEVYLKECSLLPATDSRAVNAKKSVVNLNASDLSTSTGLFMVENPGDIFAGTPSTPTTTTVSPLLTPVVLRSRTRPSITPPVTTSSVSSSSTTTSYPYFNGFSLLPLALTLFEKNNPARRNFTISQSAIDSIANGRDFFKHTLIIETRLTSYEINNIQLGNGTSEKAMTYTYYEDGAPFERVFVNADFLGACLHKTLYQYIEQLHSSRVIYNSLKFDSFETKKWVQNGSYCTKGSLQQFESKEIPFKLIQVGKNPLNVVNFRTNLLFTADFPPLTGNFYKTNRFVTCSAFTSQDEVAELQYQALFEALEKAFCETVFLSDYPEVSLTPCFERGTIVQIAEQVYFKGLVSNAAASPEP